MKPAQDHTTEAIIRLKRHKSLVSTWTEAYEKTLCTRAAYKRRLKELKSWDKPLVSRNSDPNGQWHDWAAKIDALLGLINASEL